MHRAFTINPVISQSYRNYDSLIERTSSPATRKLLCSSIGNLHVVIQLKLRQLKMTRPPRPMFINNH